MGIEDRWLLPDGVEDVLPAQAKRVEGVRRRLLDLFSTWGYEYVIPPMIEYLESLLTGTGHDLDLKTFKVVDLLTGRTMGVRADITPQVARIDAHSLNRDGMVRLCYAGTVVQAQAETMLHSRIPLSVGAELFGESSSRADVEIVSLMVESLKIFELSPIHVDLGDVSIFRQLIDSLSLSPAQTEVLFEAVQKKAVADIDAFCQREGLDDSSRVLLTALPGLTGGVEVLGRATALFSDYPGVQKSIGNLADLAAGIGARFKDLDIYFDLSELRGYAYHTGIVFAVYAGEGGGVIAKGGRYDHIGEVFGRQLRGATGFSIDVRNLADKVDTVFEKPQSVLVGNLSAATETETWQEIQRLRGQGYVVVESGNADDFDLQLTREQEDWQLVPLRKTKGR